MLPQSSGKFKQHQPRPRVELKAHLAPRTSFTSLGVGVGAGEEKGEQLRATESALDLEPRGHIPTGHHHGLSQIPLPPWVTISSSRKQA